MQIILEYFGKSSIVVMDISFGEQILNMRREEGESGAQFYLNIRQ